MNKNEIVKELREMADVLEKIPFDLRDGEQLSNLTNIYLHCATKESFSRHTRALGSFTKVADGDLNAIKNVGEGRIVVWIGQAQVCERIVTGKKTIAAVPEREEEIVEYKCPDSFLNLKEDNHERTSEIGAGDIAPAVEAVPSEV